MKSNVLNVADFFTLVFTTKEGKKAVFCNFHVIGFEYHNPEYAILIHINAKSPLVCHNTQVLQHHRPGYNPLLYIQQQGQQHLQQS